MNHYRCVRCYFPRTRSIRDCDTVTFFPTTVPFPEIKLGDFLRQAASDIITILTQPPSTTVPSLQAGDPVLNALTTLATQLKQIEDIPAIHSPPAASPRVETKTQNLQHQAVPSLPRVSSTIVVPPTSTPTSVLLAHSDRPKNVRFDNKNKHRYPLRSRTLHHKITLRSATHKQGTNFKDLAARVLVAQQIFQHKACHIFRPNGTKESIDSLLKGPLREIREKSLSNEWGRPAQGNTHGVSATDTIDFIRKHEVP